MKPLLKKMIWILVLLLPVSSFAQMKSFSFNELDSLQKIQKRYIVVFIHTDWCRYCQAMEHTTFKNSKTVKLLNEQFWFVDLNAEDKKEIIFKGYRYKYKPTGTDTGVHELAEQLCTINGKLSYPTLCILNVNDEIVFQYGEFLSSDQLQKILLKF